MKKFILIVIAVLIVGCTTTKKSHDANFPLLKNDQFYAIKKDTPIDRELINDVLKHQYTIFSGVYLNEESGDVNVAFDAVKEDKVAFSFYLNLQGTLNYLEATDKDLTVLPDIKITTPFNKIYSDALSGECKVTDRINNDVICPAPGNANIYLVFSGEWSGPSSLIPSNDKLKDWVVTKIIWLPK